MKAKLTLHQTHVAPTCYEQATSPINCTYSRPRAYIKRIIKLIDFTTDITEKQFKVCTWIRSPIWAPKFLHSLFQFLLSPSFHNHLGIRNCSGKASFRHVFVNLSSQSRIFTVRKKRQSQDFLNFILETIILKSYKTQNGRCYLAT